MANRFSLDAVIRPTVDDAAVDREVSDMERQFQDGIGNLEPGVEGLGGAAGGAGGGLGGLGGGAAVGAGARGLLGGAAKAALPVALAGATAFGIQQGIQRLAEASPALKQTQAMFGEAMDLFFRPFGNALAETFRPWASQALTMAQNFNELAESNGLRVAVDESLSGTGGGGSPMFPVVPDLSTAGLFDMLGFEGMSDKMEQFEKDFEEAGGTAAGFTLPNVNKMWSDLGGWPNVNVQWSNIGWPDVGGQWHNAGGWPDVSLPGDFWPTVEWPGWGEIIDTVQGNGGDNGGGNDRRTNNDGGGPDYIGSGPEFGRGDVRPGDPRLASNQVDELTAEELRRSRKANEQMVEELKALRRGRTSETVDPFMSR